MPELPEVETVSKTLNNILKDRKIVDINVYYPSIIEYPSLEEFKKEIVNQNINGVSRRGKWLMFDLDDYYLLSHLRMEGRYFVRKKDEPIIKHEHISFVLDNEDELRYLDTRKFGRMHLLPKDLAYDMKPLSELGLEPFSKELTVLYLKDKYKSKKLPIKTVILDQSIIVGVGNIYADEILFLCGINPYEVCSLLSNKNLQDIINNTIIVLNKAIDLGGTTIRTYESSEGVHGRFQNELLVHTKELCPKCSGKIEKVRIGGRGTYYCPKCQKKSS